MNQTYVCRHWWIRSGVNLKCKICGKVQKPDLTKDQIRGVKKG